MWNRGRLAGRNGEVGKVEVELNLVDGGNDKVGEGGVGGIRGLGGLESKCAIAAR